MKYLKGLIEERIGWIKTTIKWEESRLDESLKGSENLSARIKENVAELKELNEALINLH